MAATVSLLDVPVKSLPQLADVRKSVAAAVGKHAAVLEPKMNGWRAVWKIDPSGHARSYTRNGNEMTGKMPAIEAALAEALPPGTILDSEVVAFGMKDGHLIHQWDKVQEALGSGTAKAALRSGVLTLVVFDLLAHGGIDARSQPYSKRRELLETVFKQAEFDPKLVLLIPKMEATDANYEALLAGGYEGGVVKLLDAPYASGQRGRGWFKVKSVDTADVVVMGFKPGTAGSAFDGLVGAIDFGMTTQDGILVHRGRTSGVDWETRLAITANPGDYLGRVFELAYQEITKPSDTHPFGAFLFPRFKHWRPDKSAEDCVVVQKPCAPGGE